MKRKRKKAKKQKESFSQIEDAQIVEDERKGRRKYTIRAPQELDSASLKIHSNSGKSSKNKFHPHFPHLGYRLALLGLTNKQMASVFQVSERVFNNWLAQHHNFRKKVLEGKEEADGNVVESMYKSAIGFEKDVEVVLSNKVKEYDENGKVIREYTEPLHVTQRKYFPPQVKAQVKWLTQRQPDVWGNVKNVNVNHSVNLNRISLKDFDEKELLVLEKMGLEAHPTQEEDVLDD